MFCLWGGVYGGGVCGGRLWRAFVGSVCGERLWGAFVGSICGEHLWRAFVEAFVEGVCSTYSAIADFPTQHTIKVIDYQTSTNFHLMVNYESICFCY